MRTTLPTPVVPLCILVLRGRRTNAGSLTLPVLSADITQAEYVGLREMLEERVGRPGADHLMQSQERLEHDLDTGSAGPGMESAQEEDGVVWEHQGLGTSEVGMGRRDAPLHWARVDAGPGHG